MGDEHEHEHGHGHRLTLFVYRLDRAYRGKVVIDTYLSSSGPLKRLHGK